MGVDFQVAPQYGQGGGEHNGGGQHHEAAAFFIQQFAKQRGGQGLGNAGWHEDEAGGGAGEQQHLLGVDGDHQFEAEEEEAGAGEDGEAEAELSVLQGTQV